MILCAAFSALTDLKEDLGDSDAEDTGLDTDDVGLDTDDAGLDTDDAGLDTDDAGLDAEDAEEVYDGLGSALNWDETEFLSHGILPPYPVSRLP